MKFRTKMLISLYVLSVPAWGEELADFVAHCVPTGFAAFEFEGSEWVLNTYRGQEFYFKKVPIPPAQPELPSFPQLDASRNQIENFQRESERYFAWTEKWGGYNNCAGTSKPPTTSELGTTYAVCIARKKLSADTWFHWPCKEYHPVSSESPIIFTCDSDGDDHYEHNGYYVETTVRSWLRDSISVPNDSNLLPPAQALSMGRCTVISSDG